MDFNLILKIASTLALVLAYFYGKRIGKSEYKGEINGEMLRQLKKIKNDNRLSDDDIARKLHELKNK